MINKYTVIVEEGIDGYLLSEVIEAICAVRFLHRILVKIRYFTAQIAKCRPVRSHLR